MDSNKPVFTILSFVGGGIRGLLSVTILNRLYAVKKSVVTGTGLIAGCSTGSIITSELLADKTPQDLIDLFKGNEIGFYNDMNPDPKTPAYSIDKVLVSQELLHGQTKVAEATRNVLFVSFNVGGADIADDGRVVPRPWDSLMFTNMLKGDRDKADGLDGHADTPIARAATSSGAMPGQLGSLDGNVDGAFFNHDPTVAAISLAVRNGVPLENIVAITIGTGLMPDWIVSDTHDWGAHQWMNGVGNPFDNTPPFLMNQSRPSPMLDMCLSGTSANTMPRLAKMLLGDRYVNINPALPCFIPENSTSSQAIDLLERHGNTVDIEEAKALVLKYWPDTPLEPVARRAGGSQGKSKAVPAGSRAAAISAPPTVPPGAGEFFCIKRMLSDDVLDVSDESPAAGAKVIAYPRKLTGLNQQWQFIASEEHPGWYFLQTAMSTGMVMTLQPARLAHPPIVMQPRDPALVEHQLWSLVSTRELGWWFIQSYSQSMKVDTVNPNGYNPTVIGAFPDGEYPHAMGTTLDYLAFEPQAWGFMRLGNTG